ncbi:MAG TPA: PEGA domain-containing protein [Lacunisphaera sp.]|jgi:hypothetical protein|nr:PEGA domain-containing protein [Lacunisphaera sp.]
MKRYPILLVGSALVAILFSSGCASIVKGTTQPIPVTSDPTGAEVKLDGNKLGQTPLKIEAKRKADHLLTIEKAGYQTESVAITRNIGGAVFGNIIAGGLVGWGVDAISGAQYNLTPTTINITLRQNTTETNEPVSKSSAAVFIDELKKLDALHEAKQITDEEYGKMRTSLVDKYSK